jgi:hypothetical protein
LGVVFFSLYHASFVITRSVGGEEGGVDGWGGNGKKGLERGWWKGKTGEGGRTGLGVSRLAGWLPGRQASIHEMGGMAWKDAVCLGRAAIGFITSYKIDVQMKTR